MQQKSTMIASVRFLTLAREGIFGTLDVMIERTLFCGMCPEPCNSVGSRDVIGAEARRGLRTGTKTKQEAADKLPDDLTGSFHK